MSIRESQRRPKRCLLIPYRNVQQDLHQHPKENKVTIGAGYYLFLEGYSGLSQQAAIYLSNDQSVLDIPHSITHGNRAPSYNLCITYSSISISGAYYPTSISLTGPSVRPDHAKQKWVCNVQINGQHWCSPPYRLRYQKALAKKVPTALPDSTPQGFFDNLIHQMDQFLSQKFPEEYPGSRRHQQSPSAHHSGSTSLQALEDLNSYLFGSSDGDHWSPTYSSLPLLDDDLIGDIAYWHPANLSDKPKPGDIVAIRDSLVCKDTSGTCMLSIVPFPNMPWKICKQPRAPTDRQNGVLVTYLGEVKSKVQGILTLPSDREYFVLASGNNDGFGIVKSVSEITSHDFPHIVGKVVRSEQIYSEDSITFVPTLVCLNFSSVGIAALQFEVNKLSQIIDDHGVRLEKLELSNPLRIPCEFSNSFGDYTAQADDNVIQRTDETTSKIRHRIFSQDPSLTACVLVTIIHGMTGIGKTVLAQSIYHEMKTKQPDLYDQVGYINATGRTADHIFEIFYRHFSAEKFTRATSMPELALRYRIFLIVDDCDDWDTIMPLLKLNSKSHILITTQCANLAVNQRSVCQFQMEAMTEGNQLALIAKFLPDCPQAVQHDMVSYSQGCLTTLCHLIDVFRREKFESCSLLNLRSEFIHALTTPIEKSVNRLTLQTQEIQMFTALSHLKSWSLLPRNFILGYWRWMAASLQIEWSDAQSNRLLDALSNRGLISMLTLKDHKHLHICSLLYPSPVTMVNMMDVVWEYCKEHATTRFANFQQPLTDQLIGNLQAGKYSFLFSHLTELPNHPVLKFIHHKQDLAAISSDELVSLVDWSIICCHAHFFPESMQQLSHQHCQCVAQAQNVIQYLLNQSHPYCLSEAEKLLAKLLACAKLFSTDSSAHLLDPFIQIPVFVKQIIDHLAVHQDLQIQLCQQQPGLLLRLMLQQPVDAIPSFFNAMLGQLIEQEMILHLGSNLFVESDLLTDLLVKLKATHHLHDLQELESKMLAHVDIHPLCWFEIVKHRFQQLELPIDPKFDKIAMLSTMLSPYFFINTTCHASSFSMAVQTILQIVPSSILSNLTLDSLLEFLIEHEFAHHNLTHQNYAWLPILVQAGHQQLDPSTFERILFRMATQANVEPICWLSSITERVEMLNVPQSHWIHSFLFTKEEYMLAAKELNAPLERLFQCSACSHAQTSIQVITEPESLYEDDITFEIVASSNLESSSNNEEPSLPTYTQPYYITDVQIDEKIGEGNFGQVFRATYQDTTQIAVKRLNSQDELFGQEAELLRSIKHPHIVTFLGIYQDISNIQYIATEWMPLGSLDVFFQGRGRGLTFRHRLSLALNACAGVHALHRKNIIHRDLACRNLLVGHSSQAAGKYIVKVGDFGLAKMLPKDGKYIGKKEKMPVYSAAPEVWLRKEYSFASDIWALGVTLVEIFSGGKNPLSHIDIDAVQQFIVMGGTPSLPPSPTPILTELLTECFSSNPSSRPTALEIFQRLSPIETASKEKDHPKIQIQVSGYKSTDSVPRMLTPPTTSSAPSNLIRAKEQVVLLHPFNPSEPFTAVKREEGSVVYLPTKVLLNPAIVTQSVKADPPIQPTLLNTLERSSFKTWHAYQQWKIQTQQNPSIITPQFQLPSTLLPPQLQPIWQALQLAGVPLPLPSQHASVASIDKYHRIILTRYVNSKLLS